MSEFKSVFEKKLKDLYGTESLEIEAQKGRFLKLVDTFEDNFGLAEVTLISTPGRTELSGNHTDHNNGIVLAGSINLDSIAACSPVSEDKIVIKSEGFEELINVELKDLESKDEEIGTTEGLVRGIASRFKDLGYNIGGFNATITSNVLQGSGLSSSASIEVLVGTILSALYNKNMIDAITIAQIGQFAENSFFGKPCGLMDQMACAIGGIVKIDFADSNTPEYEKVDIDFEDHGLQLMVVDCGESHDNLTDEYASIPEEMRSVAKEFNFDFLREIEFDKFLSDMDRLRKKYGDRAVLRALHFFKENERVEKQYLALKNRDVEEFLNLVNESGNSSFKYLQNIFATINAHNQPISLALVLTEEFISNVGKGACRVHGGGFAGTILVFLPINSVHEYKNVIEPVFGKNSVKQIRIRKYGSYIF